MHTLTEQPSRRQEGGALPHTWSHTRDGLWINYAEEVYADIHPALLRRLSWRQRERVVIARHIDRAHRTFSREAKVVRAVLWPRTMDCAPYDWVVRAVASYYEFSQAEAEELVHAAVTDPAALLSVLIRVDKR